MEERKGQIYCLVLFSREAGLQSVWRGLKEEGEKNASLERQLEQLLKSSSLRQKIWSIGLGKFAAAFADPLDYDFTCTPGHDFDSDGIACVTAS